MAKEKFARQLAVALGFDADKDTAPQVLAKGAGKTAARIIEMAEANGIPVRTDADLVLALAKLDLGEVIPPEIYPAVAEVLAYVYSMNGKKITR